MKFLKYFLAVASLLSLAACNHDPDEIVISNNGPKFTDHRDVVVNDLTINEQFTLTWSAARFGVETDVEYTLTATANGETLQLCKTRELNYSSTNADLFELFGIRLTGNYEFTFELKADGLDILVEDYLVTTTINFTYDKVTWLWALGAYQGWDASGKEGVASRFLQGSDGLFRGFLHLPEAGEFKFTSQPNWDGTNYGAGEGEGLLSDSGDAGNLSLAAGLYYMEISIDELSFNALPLTSVSLIGEAVGGWDKDVTMSYDAMSKTWTAIANVVSGKEYKVRFNNAWDINGIDCSLGGDVADLEFKGSNLIGQSEGIAMFSLSLFDYPYHISEGSVSENEEVLYVANSSTGWDYMAAAKMQANYDDAGFTGTFVGTTYLSEAGEYLFARMQTPLGTRFGGSLDALTAYAGGAEAQGIAASQGLHYLYADLKNNKATDIEITSVGLVGAFNGWNAGAPAELTYDSNSKSWKATVDFATNGEFKIIFNKMWSTEVDGMTHQLSMGGSCANLQMNGGNIYMVAGTHSFELNLNKGTLATDGAIVDFSPNPERLHVTGDFGDINWTHGSAPQLWGDKDQAKYWGYVSMYGATYGFKFTHGDEPTWIGGALVEGTEYNFTLGGGDNMMIPDGLYRWDVSLGEMTATAQPLTRVGLIGSATSVGWDADLELVRDEADGYYKLNDVTLTDGEIKIRFNDAWTYSLGGSLDELVDNGSNIVVSAGTYDVVLDLTHTPKLTLTAK